MTTREGMATSNNDLFLRVWPEVSISKVSFCTQPGETPSARWYPYNKGGEFRRWYGNNVFVVDWEHDGVRIRNSIDTATGRIRSHNYNGDYAFRPGITWSAIASGNFACRKTGVGFLFDSKGAKGFVDDIDFYLALLNSLTTRKFLDVLAPTLDYKVGDIIEIPVPSIQDKNIVRTIAVRCESLAKTDWDSYETSWDFQENSLVAEARHFGEIMLSDIYDVVRINWAKATVQMRELEIQNNEIFIKAYGLEGELSPDVPWNEVSLTCNPWYRYGREVPENVDSGSYGVVSEMPMDAGLEKHLRADTAKELISYAVGCMMGRYSLDKPGLVLADAGGTIEDYHAKLREAGVDVPRFDPDEDGILPILDADWFEDDIVTRFHAFLRAAFGEANFLANVSWLESALGKDLRAYFVKDFYADHVQRYQKRPIYWLFSSKKGKFQALVYLHRYRPDTPGRVLGYLRSYIAKVTARIEALDRVAADPSAPRSAQTAALREKTKLVKAQAELADYERDVLYPLSTERPALDLDDGVKANYPKLGAALRKIF